jgi:hypothetical protein
VGRPVPAADLLAAADAARRLAEDLERAAGPGKAPRRFVGTDGRRIFLPTGPMTGAENPLAPPARIWTVEGTDGPELRGTVRFGYPYEGPPTCVHGGVLAELFDEVLGAALVAAGRPGMTGTLTVRYRRPTPLQADLDIVARATTVEGRKLGVWGATLHAGEPTAEAHGVFIAVDPAYVAGIMREHEEASDVDLVDPELRALAQAGGSVPTGE